MERVQSVSHADAMLDAAVASKLAFESFKFGPEDVPARCNDARTGLFEFLADAFIVPPKIVER